MEIIIDNKLDFFSDFSPDQKIKIADAALKVFAPYAPVDKSNLHKLPVAEIIKRHNILVVPYSLISNDQLEALRAVSPDFTEFGLFYQNEEGKAFIYYNDAKSKEVQELTLFHELGHMFLKHSQQSNLAEREADFFAAFCLGYITLLRQFKTEVNYETT